MVIGFIALIAAILAPVLVNAQQPASRAKCQSNLSQIARAFNAYLGDYDSCYPNTDNQYLWSGFYWREPIRRYVGLGAQSSKQMVLACPCDPTPPGIYAGTSYAYSGVLLYDAGAHRCDLQPGLHPRQVRPDKSQAAVFDNQNLGGRVPLQRK